MKKYILPIVALALLTGCGKVSDVKDTDKPINIVSGTVEGTTRDISTTDTEATTDDDTVSGTTTKTAGNKVSGTTTTAKAGSKKSAVTRANGGSGGVYGTTRAVPVAPKSTTKTKATTAATTTQPATQAPKADFEDCSTISFGISENTSNKIDVSRQYNDGKARSYQVLSADTSGIQEAIKKDPSKTVNDFVIKNDLDFDGYPDIFIIEKPDELNKTGKYYRYDHETGNYQAWQELNGIHFELNGNAELKQLKTTEQKEDGGYEEKIYVWNEQKQLVILKYTHKYKSGDSFLIDYVDYDNNGAEILRETRDENGSLVGGNNEETKS
ncbi:membrane lipoprotein lipid attachment site-containing protein [Ruminococcus flavefaciens]|uniref:Lipoprotein n=1 Tax=Ruminococcus flavefaciens TaxID=1265 RepID=A0A1M7JNN3_RUMFL|nr:membrane lipoprotein lipid attachment site-containing protein [Ruminococcus flavefaciens]SHM54719.1 hypothetical protein SAMN04487860_106131 [Ruminococcus flavefaciens]